MTDALIVACFFLALFFPIAYSRSRWTLYRPGRALMFFSIIVSGVLGLGFYRVATGEFAPDWIRTAAYLAVFIALLVMDVTLLAEQRNDRAKIAQERREGIERLREKETK